MDWMEFPFNLDKFLATNVDVGEEDTPTEEVTLLSDPPPYTGPTNPSLLALTTETEAPGIDPRGGKQACPARLGP